MNRTLSLDPFSYRFIQPYVLEDDITRFQKKQYNYNTPIGWTEKLNQSTNIDYFGSDKPFKEAFDQSKKSKQIKRTCWKGYHRVKGTVPYSKKSCVKNKYKK